MSQPDLETSFTKKSHRQIYSEVAPDNPAIAADGRIVIIAGGSKGIGHAIANAFATANATAVVLLARNQTDLEDAKTLLKSLFDNTVFCYCPVDITDSSAVAGVFQTIRATLGEPNILILCAAYLHLLKPALDLPADEVDRSFEMNFKANVNLVHQFYNPKKDYEQIKILINVSTVAAHTQQPNMSAYGASKAALVHWLEHVHVENQNRLRVHHMHPGIVRTDLLRNREFGADDWDWENVDLPAAVAVWLTSPEAAFLAGRFIWASWDVNELTARAEEIRNGRYLLKLGLVGSPHEEIKREITDDLLKLRLVGSPNEDEKHQITNDLFELEGQTQSDLVNEKEDVDE